jgi:sugar phosphate isomerase/epimerase
MGTIAVSSFSLFQQRGPLHFESRGEDGVVSPQPIDLPTTISLEQFIEQVPSHAGVSAVELCQVQFGDSSPERIAQLKSALSEAGVALATIPIDLGDLSSSEAAYREDDVARIIRWFDIAHELGARFVRVRIGDPAAGSNQPDSALVESLRTLAGEAERRGLQLLVENHGGLSSDPEFLLGLQQAVGPGQVGILLDLGNFEPVSTISVSRILGQPLEESGVDAEPIYEKIAALAPHARLVHAKAIDPGEDGRHLLDLDRSLAIVAAAGYDGDISVEWEGLLGDPWANVREVIGRIRKAFPLATAVTAS